MKNSCLLWNRLPVFILLILGILYLNTRSQAETVRRGAKVVKSPLGETAPPKLILPDGWTLCEDEALTGLNVREYYFTIEADTENLPKNFPNPTVQILWPNVKIAEIRGAQNVHKITDGMEFQVSSTRTPTGFTSILPQMGSVSMGIFHNVPGMQAGRYRDLPYPANQIQAHLNYLFGSREMMAEMGFTAERKVEGIINLYGFETNYPNGHVDYPPHFHIMLMWDSWRENHVSHFILDETGKILVNNHQVMGEKAPQTGKSGKYLPGESMNYTDKTGKICFTVRMLENGHGVELSVPGTEKQARVCSEKAVDSVSCFVRENASAAWQKTAEIRVLDDAVKGILTVTTEREAGTQTETWTYNPIDGHVLTTPEK